MKQKIVICCLLLAAVLCAAGAAVAQTPVQKNIRVRWTLPTVYDDGTPLPASAITSIQVFVANSAIPDSFTGEPTATLTAAATTTDRTVQAWSPGAIHVRVKACTASACGDFSPGASLNIPGVRPGVPTQVTIELVVVPAP
jgi:hypothetical protein